MFSFNAIISIFQFLKSEAILVACRFLTNYGGFDVFALAMAPRKGKEKKEEQVISLGPQVAEGENVFGVCHIFASFNDTFVHVTDLSGK